MTQKERRETYDMFGGRCAYCGQSIKYKDMQIDHIKPIYRGRNNKPDRAGDNTSDNFFPSCRSCNHRKGTLTIEQFRRELEKAYERLLRDNATFRIAERYGIVKRGEKEKVLFLFEKVY